VTRPSGGGRRRDLLRGDDDGERNLREASPRRYHGLRVIDRGQFAERVREASLDAIADDDARPRRERAEHVGGTLGGGRHPNIVGAAWAATRCYGV
jgi:hypothetical protein